MKFGFRTPSIEKKLKAKTTGALKRKAKKAVNPLYSKKGMGIVNNPKKALYNKIYNKTTIDPLKLGKGSNNCSEDDYNEDFVLDKAVVKEFLREEGYVELIDAGLPEHSKEFILNKVVKGIEDGTIEDGEDIEDYINTLCSNFMTNKKIFKVIGVIFKFLKKIFKYGLIAFGILYVLGLVLSVFE